MNDRQTRIEQLQAEVLKMSDEDVMQLYNAIQSHAAGDKGAIKRLADRKGRELEKLRKQAIKDGVKV